MYGIQTTTPPPTSPVSAAQLRARLRLNDTSEDGELVEMIGAAVEKFEGDTSRPVLATTYRQSFTKWPCGRVIILGRGGVTSVAAVGRYLADGTPEDLDADQWRADLVTPPARVLLAAIPDAVTTAAGIDVTAGYVDFTAGWATPSAVPSRVLTAIKLLAGHFYEHREAYHDGTLTELPAGWASVVSNYKTGITGDLGQ